MYNLIQFIIIYIYNLLQPNRTHLFIIGNMPFRAFFKEFPKVCSLVLMPSFNICFQINVCTLQSITA